MKESIKILLMFAAHEEALEFELVFGHRVHGPLKMLKETWLSDDNPPIGLLDYVCTFRCQLSKACEMARENLKHSQRQMKVWYDCKVTERTFQPGDKVLM